jgi:2-haloacid dehalogenase
VLVFDVNETLSDMAPMAARFAEVGAPGLLARAWFAGVLRDGFALAVAGAAEPFAEIGEDNLRSSLAGLPLTRGLEEAVAHVMAGFGSLEVHPDVPEGIRRLAELDLRLVTLSNGSASVARRLLGRAGLLDHLELMLSVEDAGVWKPAAAAYHHAVQRCGVAPADAMLVAVHPWDTDGARRAGLGSAWVNRDGGTFPGHFGSPDLEATSLVALADRLR